MCFWEFLGAVQGDKCFTKTTQNNPKQGSLLRAHTQQFSIPKVHRGYLVCDNPWGVVLDAGTLNDFSQPFPAQFALTSHCSARVSCGSLLLAWLGAQDSRDRNSVPEHPSLSPSSKVLPCGQGFPPLLSERGANSAVVLILLGPEEVINWSVYSF